MSTRRGVGRAPRGDDLLVVDVGNTKVQALLVRSGAARLRWRVEYGAPGSAWSGAFAAGAARARAATRARLPIVVASVAPARAARIDAVLRRLWRTAPHQVDWRDPWPFRLAVRDPATLGADRLANVAGLRALGLQRGIAIDAGTAVTIDVLDDGCFLGGLILPGAALAARALHAHTAKLPLVRLHADVPLIGDATQSALQAGIFHGLVHALRGIARALAAQHGKSMRVVLTGGHAALLAPHFPGARHEPDLLFLGLCHVAARRARRPSRR